MNVLTVSVPLPNSSTTTSDCFVALFKASAICTEKYAHFYKQNLTEAVCCNIVSTFLQSKPKQKHFNTEKIHFFYKAQPGRSNLPQKSTCIHVTSKSIVTGAVYHRKYKHFYKTWWRQFTTKKVHVFSEPFTKQNLI